MTAATVAHRNAACRRPLQPRGDWLLWLSERARALERKEAAA